MNIDKSQEGRKLTLSIKGSLDTASAPQFQETLLSAFTETQQIELDFSNVSYVSSAGLRVLLIGQKTANTQGASMTLCKVTTEVMEVFEITGFADILVIV